MTKHLDVVIVGAGISGICAAYHMQKECPNKSFAILEGRADMGGTWTLFKYPGIRSDSDMYTLGFPWRPWRDPKAIADAPDIMNYLRETVEEIGIGDKIIYNSKVTNASWDSDAGLWTITVSNSATGTDEEMTCNFLFMCSGYYNYEEGFNPVFEGRDDFKGDIIHPQHWPENYDYTGKKVVVIGSGATAVTLVPAMTDKAEKVTMLQRTPSYVVSRPNDGALAHKLAKFMPEGMKNQTMRWISIIMGMLSFNWLRNNPEKGKAMLTGWVKQQLGEELTEKHFTPDYAPWDQRICAVPDADMFKCIREGKAEVVTDHIERFTENGILLKSGDTIEADLIITATGLNLQLFGGMGVQVDGKDISFGDTLAYKGMMFSGVPNLANTMGYTNASWTLKADLTDQYVCRLINHMDKNGYSQCVPVADDNVEIENFLDFSSGYVQRAVAFLPKQGAKKPWKVNQNYVKDMMFFKFSKLEDGVMEFSNKVKKGVSADEGKKAA